MIKLVNKKHMISKGIFDQMVTEIVEKVSTMRGEYQNDTYLSDSYLEKLSDKIKKVYEIVCE